MGSPSGNVQLFLLVAIVVELVVRTQCRQGSCADAVGEENLRRTIYPGPRPQELFPARRHVIQQTLFGAVERHGANQKDEQHRIREQGREPDDLQAQADSCLTGDEIICYYTRIFHAHNNLPFLALVFILSQLSLVHTLLFV